MECDDISSANYDNLETWLNAYKRVSKEFWDVRFYDEKTAIHRVCSELKAFHF